ncbi:winged helix-turn-helix domain-containing protein [Streptomyces sp. B1866]|uniref:ArsR/SmtB family transcription factor n=1 Tax=Streptomyces sp. B1866 TaxID=3075431 RepID=UPI00288F567A|nr:winged helix-turn-helix domain-containing protein [Streptomyces sp. B1866]MDT3395563.1 winged helix-turn-helix domain-containing protein [Streptomyces sp. B1866]
MGWWQVNADTLAESRFVPSALAETTASLMVLHRGEAAHPGERAWLAAHLPAYRERLAADPLTALLVRAALGRRWIADFLTPTPTGEAGPGDGEAAFEEELARLRATPPDTARADLTVSLRGPLPARLDRSDLPARAADLLAWVWRETVRPTWPRRRRIVEADIVARTRQVGQGGWAAALEGMRPGLRWLGGSRLQINAYDNPPREISGARLLFVPVTPKAGWVSWDLSAAEGAGESGGPARAGAGGVTGRASGGTRPGPVGAAGGPERSRHRYAVVYPCAGQLADPERTAAPEPLGRLLGPARAAVLVLLDAPKSTTQLVALTGQGLGSVGRHLKVLLDAGLVLRRRAGRSVLYYRTAVGDALVRAQGEPAGRRGGLSAKHREKTSE